MLSYVSVLCRLSRYACVFTAANGRTPTPDGLPTLTKRISASSSSSLMMGDEALPPATVSAMYIARSARDFISTLLGSPASLQISENITLYRVIVL